MPYDPSEGLINGAQLVGGLINQGQKASGYVDSMFDAHARRAAGEAIANGDTNGAAGLLGSRGFLDEAQSLKDRAAASSTLSSITNKDFTGAKTTAAASGDPALLNTATTAEQADKTARTAWMAHAADALLQIKDPARRQSAYETAIKPTLKAMGLQDEQLAQIGAQSLTDEGLQTFKATLGQMDALDIQKMDDGSILGIDKKTGAVKVLHNGAPKPVTVGDALVDPVTGKVIYQGTKYEKVGEGDKLVPVGGAPGGGAAPEPTGGIYDKVDAIATSAGAKPAEVAYLKRLAQVESSGDPSATNGKSTGVFQFHPDTFAGVGGHDINDVTDQTKAALALSQRDRGALKTAGIAPTDANVYIMHQQGAAGGKALLQAPPEVGAVAALTAVYNDPKMALAAIAGNIGLPYKTAEQKTIAKAKAADMTAGDFVSMWQSKWAGGKGGARLNEQGDPVGTIYGSKDANGELGDDAVEQAAERYIVNGTLPPMGMGKTGTLNRDKILNKAAEMEKATGRTGAEAVAAWAGVKANQTTLTDLTKRRGNIKAFEDNAIANADLALSLAPKGAAPLNVPIINRWVQTGRKAVAGDPNVTQFDIALGTFLDEYAKITSGSMGNQGTTDASRREAYDRLSKFATKGQLAAGISTMKQEMGNRVAGLDQEIASTTAAISGGAGRPKPAAAVAPRPDGWSKLLPAAQLAEAKKYAGAKGPGGAPDNPFVPTSQAQFDHLQTGQWFINPADGKKLQKK